MLEAALISGASSLLGGMMGNAASAKQAAKQMDFQREMSNTAHQREVTDLRAAGLNPILSATKGLGGSSTPMGAAAPQTDAITPAVNSGLNAYMRSQEVENMKAQQEVMSSQALKNRAEAWKANSDIDVNQTVMKANYSLAEQRQAETGNLIVSRPHFSAWGSRTEAEAQAARSASVRNIADADLAEATSALNRAKIPLTQQETQRAIQIIAMDAPWTTKQGMLSALLATPAGKAKMGAEITAETVGNILSGVTGLKNLFKK